MLLSFTCHTRQALTSPSLDPALSTGGESVVFGSQGAAFIFNELLVVLIKIKLIFSYLFYCAILNEMPLVLNKITLIFR